MTRRDQRQAPEADEECPTSAGRHWGTTRRPQVRVVGPNKEENDDKPTATRKVNEDADSSGMCCGR